MAGTTKPKRESEAKHWCFTLNDAEDNLEHTDVIEIWGPHCSYLVFQEEKGEEGTKHYQGYAEFTKAHRLSAIKKMAKHFQPHWEKRKGKPAEARAYCMKEDTRVAGPWEHGEWKGGNQGSRTDLVELAEAIKAGKSVREIFEEYPASTIRYVGNINKLKMLYKPKRTEEMQVTLSYGAPGTGKTKYFWDAYPENGWALPVSKDVWFDGYQNEQFVLIDDFAGNIGLTQLLQILDQYVPSVQVKGSFTWWNPLMINITTNLHPWQWYDYSTRQDSYAALKRRITRVYHFTCVDGVYDVTEKDKEVFFEEEKVERAQRKKADDEWAALLNKAK